jgi:hypothetical protein
LLKEDLAVLAPSHNISEDVEKFEELHKIITKTMEELDSLSAAKDLQQILQKIP